MRRRLLVALAVVALAVSGMTVGAVASGGFLGDPAPPGDTADVSTPTNTETPTPDDAVVTFDGETPLELAVTDEAVVSGTADLDAGTTVSVRIQSADDAGPKFFKSAEATVGEDGSFAATFDLSQFKTERDVTVSVATGADTVTADGHIVAPESGFSDADSETDSDPDTESDTDATDAGPSVELDADSLELAATDNATVSGTTTAAPGTELSVRLRNTDEGSPFFMSRTATVDEDGRFSVTFDLSSIYEEREGRVTVGGENVSHSTTASVVAPDGGFPDAEGVEASFDGAEPVELAAASNQTVSGSTNLDDGAEVSVRLRTADGDTRLLDATRTTVDANGSFTATFDLGDIEAGQDVTLELVVHRETVTTSDGTVVEASAE